MPTTRITFTRPAADRIANVVRIVEQGSRDEAPLTFRRVAESSSKTFRIGTFTGAWPIGGTKTITFKYVTTTPNTVAAVNLFASVSGACGERDCAIARDGSWHLVAVQCE